MNLDTLKILNKLQRGNISYKKACKLLKKTEEEIDKLFDSDDYRYIPTLKDEKKLFQTEKENVSELINIANLRQKIILDTKRSSFPGIFIQAANNIPNSIIPYELYIERLRGNLTFENKYKNSYQLNQ